MEKKQTNENRKFLGIWIPKEIYLNNNLSWTDKILVIEILSLDNERGCFASNDYFAEFLGVTKTTISTSISKLKELGFIEQISFDGRTRILKAVYKKIDNPHTRKLKGRIQENLKHNNTVNKTTNKTIKKEKKYIQKIDENLKDEKPKLSNDPVINTKVNSILNGATYINVEDLKKEREWLEHCSRYLLLDPFFTNNLLNQFIDEQKLKDDEFKSAKETKSHFLNWAKIEVAKTRKFGNEQWGKTKPKTMHQQKQNEEQKDLTPKISDAEKKRLHKDFITKNLLKPFDAFCKTGFFKVQNFGGIVYKELKKYDLIENDVSKLEYIKKGIEARKEKLKRGSIRKAMMEQFDLDDETNYEMELIKDSFVRMNESNVDLKEIIKL
tara:strand:+ start:1352 stop:2497 length:1146 start_codon:yes stop_codon:yes gene_type:complete